MKDPHTILISYQPSWKDKFEAEKVKLQKIFGNNAIEHIGSTSIPGLSSKPIIDIMVMIKDSTDADTFSDLLNQIDYEFDSLSTERHFFKKGNPTEFHLSIAYMDKGSFWERQILFRDYLRSHPDSRDEY